MELGMEIVETRGFRLSGKKYLLTYRTHLNRVSYAEWIVSVGGTTKFLRMAHESGHGETEYLHTHVVVVFDNALKTTDCRKLDYLDIHPHIRKIANGKINLVKCKNYLSKEDESCADLKEELNIVDGVLRCESELEAMRLYAHSYGDVTGIKQLYSLRPSMKIRTILPTRQWQMDLNQELMAVPDDRKVIWYCDYNGAMGKTQFAKYMMVTYPLQFYYTRDMGTSRDAATIVCNALKSGWTGHGIFIDLPRSAEGHSRMYNYIEELKDGVVTATKYQGGTVLFNSPWVVVFANWEPQRSFLSEDRWDVRVYGSPVVEPDNISTGSWLESIR